MKDGSACPICSKSYFRTGKDWQYVVIDNTQLKKKVIDSDTHKIFFCSYACMRKYEQLKSEQLLEDDIGKIENEFRSGLSVDAIAHKHHCRVDDVEDIVINL